MEYTKAPWAWQEFGKDDVCLTAQHGKREIILAGHPDGTLRMNESSTGRLEKINREHPNAKLIEAAPELYEALEGLIEISFARNDVDKIIIAEAKAAIKKATTQSTETKNHLTLKWGTLKRWHFDSEKGMSLLKEYHQIGSSMSAMMQHDTQRQKEIICELIDLCDTIYLDWDGKDVSKEEAKKYVMEYGKHTAQAK